ncbi:hypothetical protein GOBAR_AA29353 [Gossypium barbadense]|uniref:Uncharacterized protein n=1 Tax=Gossypium barbadense TaxID=3634 RepID=A0A2P5WJQ6_GOSBA|nr:hypothetical protein GOBAR_AA29353 [Gossypium barbadense]
MGNKLDEQTPRVHLENFLTMDVMHLHARSKPWLLGALPCAEGTVSGSGYFTNALILPVLNGPTEGGQWWAQPFQQSIPFLSWIPYVNELPTYKTAVYLLTPIAILPTVACNISSVHKIVKARKGSMLLALAMEECSFAHKYGQAIDLYTQTIELNSQNVVYWANRSLAHTKLEEYGSAIQDATKAIEVDPKYSKACFIY